MSPASPHREEATDLARSGGGVTVLSASVKRIDLKRLRRFLRPEIIVFALLALHLGHANLSNRDSSDVDEAIHGDGKYRPVVARGDGHMLFLILRSLVLDRDVHWDNDLKEFGNPWGQPKTKNGYRDIPHPIGPAIIWAPAFVAIHGVALIANALGADIPTHGYTRFHQKPLFLTSALFAVVAVICGYHLARKATGTRAGPLWASIAVALGTSLTYYATLMPSYGHAMDAMVVAIFLWVWARSWGDPSGRRAVLIGGLLGLAALVRTQNFAFGVVLVVELVHVHIVIATEGRSPRRIVRAFLISGALALAAAVIAFLPQAFVWHRIHGEWFHHQNGAAYVRWGHPMLLELLFAAKNGWLSTTPIAYAGVLGLAFAPRGRRVFVLALVIALGLQVYLNATVYDWWASASFGQRRMCSVTAILVVGFACLAHACSRAIALIPVPSQLARLGHVTSHALSRMLIPFARIARYVSALTPPPLVN